MAQISLKQYLTLLLDGTKDYIDNQNDNINTEHMRMLNEAIANLEEMLRSAEAGFGNEHSSLWAAITENSNHIAINDADNVALWAALDGKADKNYIIPWATYDTTNKILQLGVPGSSYFIKSTTSGLEVYQGTTKVTYWENGHLKASDITASSSITIGGLTISGNSTNGWSIR